MKCIVCGNNMKVNSRIPGLLKCPGCSFVCADMRLPFHEIKRIYSGKYFNGEEYSDYAADRKLHVQNFKRRIKRMQKVLGNLDGMSVYEIGSAYGFFLKTAERYVKTARGIDVSRDAVDYAVEKLHVDAFCGNYLEEDTGTENTDIICMWDTIEHIDMPHKYLKKASLQLKKGGAVCITTGDIGSVNARIRGAKWRQIHPPTHLQYFSRKTLTRLLHRYGFSVADVTYTGNELSIKSIAYIILVLRLKWEGLYQWLDKKGLLRGKAYMNLHDYMFIIAKKI